MRFAISGTAKLLFIEGGQAALLPKEYGDFLGTQASICHDPQTHDLILSQNMEHHKLPASSRNPFEGWVE